MACQLDLLPVAPLTEADTESPADVAERERLAAAWAAETQRRDDRQRLAVEQAVWRHRVAQSTWLCSLSPMQREAELARLRAEAAESDRLSAEIHAEEARWRALTPAQRRAELAEDRARHVAGVAEGEVP